HESRRIDNQLRGRAGRQGDPGVSKFYLSLEDDLMRIFGSERISGLMERLGMEEGEVIEHKWLSKAIEGAQKRVEGHNFDIRKNLLEYDDVMNQQRRTIYKLRRQVLAAGSGIPLVEYEEDKKTKAKIRSERTITWADFREMVLDSVEDVIVAITDTFCPTRKSSSWDIEALQRAVRDAFNVEMTFNPSDTALAVQEQIYQVVEKIYVAREQEFGDDFHRFAQVRYLSTIDQLWKDHLLAMDHLRQGIGLRGYGQKDPKQEYKKEGYEGFIQMLATIKHGFVSQLMRVQARSTAEETARLQRQMKQRQRQIFEGRGGGDGKAEKAASPRQAVRQGPRVGRNEPCPCGSGKKYKKCHGSTEQLGR
ncbi:MAG TPA: SEC-C metal-binding domain-containing protein, partial [Myxococcales bacterium]